MRKLPSLSQWMSEDSVSINEAMAQFRPPFFVAAKDGDKYTVQKEVITDNENTQKSVLSSILSSFSDVWVIPGREAQAVRVGSSISKRDMMKLSAVRLSDIREDVELNESMYAQPNDYSFVHGQFVKIKPFITQTSDEGLWKSDYSRMKKPSVIITDVSFYPNLDSDDPTKVYNLDLYAYIRVGDWKTGKGTAITDPSDHLSDGLIYGDDSWLATFVKGMKEQGFELGRDFDFTEQGMQGDDWVCMGVYNQRAIKSIIKKIGMNLKDYDDSGMTPEEQRQRFEDEMDRFDNLEEQYSEEELNRMFIINEAAAIRTVRILKGQRKVYYKCPPGHHKVKAGGKTCVMTTGARKYKKSRSMKRAARKRRGHMGAINRSRKRSMRKRRGMGL